MSKRGDLESLSDINEAIKRIMFYMKDLTFDQFVQDTRNQDAVVRNLEIIGEATKNLSFDFRKKNLEVPWKKLAGVRDRLIHHYFSVNFEVIWTIVTEELPKMLIEIKKIRQNKKERA